MAWWDSTIVPLMLNSTSPLPERVLVIGHETFFASLMDELESQRGFDMSLRVGKGKTANTSISAIEIDASGVGRLVMYGNADHLVGMRPTPL